MDRSSTAGADPVTTRVVRTVEDGLIDAIDRLVPQIPGTASVPGRWELEQMVADPGAILIVAENAAVIVGMLALVVFRTPTGLHARIEDLVVDEYAELPVVAERLIRRAMKTSSSRGARTVQATCPASHAAIGRLYERLGFERKSTTAYSYKLSG
jgi:ribosomal protein S18 acetylase RimI-like enzyme